MIHKYKLMNTLYIILSKQLKPYSVSVELSRSILVKTSKEDFNMKLVWKGKLTKDKGFPVVEIPKDAKVFLGEESSWYIYIIGILILILGVVLLKIKLHYFDGLRMKRIGYLIGLALAVLFLVVHELIHGFLSLISPVI